MNTLLSGQRIAITGIGMCNALGRHSAKIWQNTLAMHSGMQRIAPSPADPPHFFDAPFIPGAKSYCDVIAPCDHTFTRHDIQLPPQDFAVTSVSTQLTLRTAAQAVKDANLTTASYSPERIGVFVSQNAAESASTLFPLQTYIHAPNIAHMASAHGLTAQAEKAFCAQLQKNSLIPDESSMLCRLNCTAAGMLCQRYGFAGPSFATTAACSSSMAAVYTALHLLAAGSIDAALVGGGEEVYNPLYIAEFCAIGALARSSEYAIEPHQYCRPFDKHRTGFILGEGAAMLTLERENTARARGAHIYGFITGAGSVTNTRGLVEPSAAAQEKAMELSFAGLDYGPQDVALVECHATGTIQGDIEEGNAIATFYGLQAGGKGAVLSAYKAQIGHTTGASGIMAIAHGLLAMRDGLYPGTINCTEPDPAIALAEAGLQIFATPQPWETTKSMIRRMQVNSFAFGGACFALQIEEYNDRTPRAMSTVPPNTALSAADDGGNASGARAVTSPRPAPSRPGFDGSELVMDGVRYVQLNHQGQPWRLGSMVPAWEQVLAGLPIQPQPEDLAARARQGVWLHKADTPPPVAVMCCGQGSIWPGMGRALYDNFPAARDAMDRIASYAAWDVLALLDEPDLDKITLTRWQQPYLFLLEYAQACYLESLGFRPNVMSGHSLGELIALCLAGVYTPVQAWYILDARAQQMAELESKATHDTGMMAVYAGQEVIDNTLHTYPDLRVSNYNTPTQFILSGPKTMLGEARRALRKQKYPAIMLNVSMAFHHPDMRVIRDISARRLNEVPMKASRIPMMSNVTTGVYPGTTPEIVEYIVDLDENAVRWVQCVHKMWDTYGIRHFVEFGPTDTMCGLTADIIPEALCISAGRKNKEVEGMRAAAAQLYALGHLHFRPPASTTHYPPNTAHSDVCAPQQTPQAPLVSASAAATMVMAQPTINNEPMPEHVAALLPLIMEATGYEVHELSPDMDLRHDLAIRSSRFPLIMHAAEKRFNISIHFEDLIGVATIRDLADVLLQLQQGAAAQQKTSPTPEDTSPEATACPQPPLLRQIPRLQALADVPDTQNDLHGQSVLLVGDAPIAQQWRDSLQACGASTTCYPNAMAAHNAVRQNETGIFGLIFALQPAEEPSQQLLQCQLLLQAVLQQNPSLCCVANECGPQWKEVTDVSATFAGLQGLLLALTLEYPKAHFTAVYAQAGAPHNDWMRRALCTSQGPVQWYINTKGQYFTPHLVAQPAAMGAHALPVRHEDVILVTGGARGITPYALEGLAPLGCIFVLLGRSPQASESTLQTLRQHGAQVVYHSCDVTDAAAVASCVQQLHATYGHIDGIIHAAGINRDATLAVIKADDMAAVLNIKCQALHTLLSLCSPLGLRYVVAFSSLAAWLGNYGQSNYSAANRAMSTLLQQWHNKTGVPYRCLWLPPIAGEGMADDAQIREQLRLRGLEHAFVHTQELGMLFARECCAASDAHVLWTRELPKLKSVLGALPPSSAAACGIAEKAALLPHVYPVSLEQGVLPTFTGGHDFSHFTDVILQTSPCRDGQAVAPFSLLLQCLCESAFYVMPWLENLELKNVRLTRPLSCPQGVTRQSRIQLVARGWQPPKTEGATPAFWWQGTLCAPKISANGRRLNETECVCEADILLARSIQHIPRLWESPVSTIWTAYQEKNISLPVLPREYLLTKQDIAIMRQGQWQWVSYLLEITQKSLLASGTVLFPVRLDRFCYANVPEAGRLLLDVRIHNSRHIDIQIVHECGSILALLENLELE